jgi:hypothetical protein
VVLHLARRADRGPAIRDRSQGSELRMRRDGARAAGPGAVSWSAEKTTFPLLSAVRTSV